MTSLFFQVELPCPHCSQPVLVQAVAAEQLCAACMRPVPLPASVWTRWISVEEVWEALTSTETHQFTFLPSNIRVSVGLGELQCEGCKAPLPEGRLAELAEGGGWTCGCGRHTSVREAGALAQAILPVAAWVVNEGEAGQAAGAGAAEPMLFQCMGCGGSLKVDGSERAVTCTYCSASNFLPDALWLRMHPPMLKRRLFLAFEPGEELQSVLDGCVSAATAMSHKGMPVAVLEQAARAECGAVRQAAAANPGLPEACMLALGEDEDEEVRAALANNKALPPALALALAVDGDCEVRRKIAKNESLSHQELRKLAIDDDREVRRAVVRHPNLSESLLVSLSEDEDVGVRVAAIETGRLPERALIRLARRVNRPAEIQALEAHGLSPEVLSALAGRRDNQLLNLVARHPDSPEEALLRVAQSGYTEPVELLLKREGLSQDLMRLILEKDQGGTAAAARERPEYAALRAARRKRWMLGGGLMVLVLGCLGGGAGVLAVGSMVLRRLLH